MPKHVLIVRNDKLGDFILSFPAIALLKKNCPDWRISVLVPNYTLPMAQLNPNIDDYVIDPGPKAPWRQQWDLWCQLRRARFDAVITIFSTFRIGLLLRFAGIPYRLAPASKLAQIFYNRRLLQRRSRSQKPEYQYNCDLVERFISQNCGLASVVGVSAPYLFAPKSDGIATLLPQRRPGRALVAIHPGSGGSANNLSLPQYAQLARLINAASHVDFVISAGPGEEHQATLLHNQLNDLNISVFVSNHGLGVFAQFLSGVDLFVAGSTGTLHLAGALDIPTLGFYPRRRSATALRWRTLNSPNKRLAISVDNNSAEQDMSNIDLQDCVNQLIAKMPQCLGLPPNIND